MTLPVFTCIRCRMSWPEQFLAYTYTHSRLCRWCQEETANIPMIVYEPDVRALTLAEVAARAAGSLDDILPRRRRWWCC